MPSSAVGKAVSSHPRLVLLLGALSAFGPLSTGITLLVFLYFASVIVLLGAEFARASALDHEGGAVSAADPRLLPVVMDPSPAPVGPSKRGLPRWALAAGAAVIGLVAGRISKRDNE